MAIWTYDADDEWELTQRGTEPIDDIYNENEAQNSKLSRSVNVIVDDTFLAETRSSETTASRQASEKNKEVPNEFVRDIKQFIPHGQRQNKEWRRDARTLTPQNDTKEKYSENPMQNLKGKLQRERMGSNEASTNRIVKILKLARICMYIFMINSAMQIQQVMGATGHGHNKHQPNTDGHALINCTIQKPFVFGKAGRISCSYNGVQDVNVRIWKKDSLEFLLAREHTTSDSRKYKATSLENGRRYDLDIHNLSLSDFGHIYTCHFGFEYREINLTLELARFEKHPDENDFSTIIHLHGDNFTADIQLIGVHPEPNCDFTFDSNLTINQNLKKVNGLFTKSWNISSMFGSATTPYILHMSCTIGSYSFLKSIVIKNETNEVDEGKPRIRPLIPIVMIAVILLCLLSLIVVDICRFRKCCLFYQMSKKKQVGNSNEMKEMINSNDLMIENDNEASHN